MKTNFVGFIKLALEVNIGMSFRQLVLCGYQVDLEALRPERQLELIVSSVRSGFGVDFERLIRKFSL